MDAVDLDGALPGPKGRGPHLPDDTRSPRGGRPVRSAHARRPDRGESPAPPVSRGRTLLRHLPCYPRGPRHS